MKIGNQIYRSKAIIGILIYALIISIGFHSYSSAETAQKSKKTDTITSPENSNEKSDNKDSALPNNSSGYEVFIDPKTGKFIEPPTDLPVTREQEETNSLETQQEEEQAVEMPAPGGGVMLEQPGGFLHDSTATIDTNGKVVIHCSDHSEHDENENTPNLDGRK